MTSKRIRKSRTDKVVWTAEGAVMRDLRLKQNLSMVEAGQRIGRASKRGSSFSSTYISQIENHRLKVPDGEYLLPFLKAYGNITVKYFRELCRNREAETTDDEIIEMALPKLNAEDKKYLRQWVEDRLKKKF